MEDIGNSLNVNQYCKGGLETSDTDDEREESFDHNDQNSCLCHNGEDK